MIQVSKRMVIFFTGLWFLLIWTASSLPTDKIPTGKLFSVDKLLHLSVYLVLALMVNLSMKKAALPNKYHLPIYLVLVISAALDEWHQRFIPNRTVSWLDFAANFSGLLVGFATLKGKR
jgi:VanZ family protein